MQLLIAFFDSFEREKVQEHGGGQRPGHGRTLMESRAADRTDRKADQTSSVEQKISRKGSHRNVLGTYSGRTGNVHFVSLVMELA